MIFLSYTINIIFGLVKLLTQYVVTCSSYQDSVLKYKQLPLIHCFEGIVLAALFSITSLRSLLSIIRLTPMTFILSRQFLSGLFRRLVEVNFYIYRPTSKRYNFLHANKPIMSKIFEFFLLNHIEEAVPMGNLISQHQSGFRENTIQECHRIVNKIKTIFEEKEICHYSN